MNDNPTPDELARIRAVLAYPYISPLDYCAVPPKYAWVQDRLLAEYTRIRLAREAHEREEASVLVHQRRLVQQRTYAQQKYRQRALGIAPEQQEARAAYALLRAQRHALQRGAPRLEERRG